MAQVFNKGTTSFELIIHSNTIINCFGLDQLYQTQTVSVSSLVNFKTLGNTKEEISK